MNIDYCEWFQSFNKKFPNYTMSGKNYQIAFSRFLIENSIKIKDYSSNYLVDFYDSNSKIINFSKT